MKQTALVVLALLVLLAQNSTAQSTAEQHMSIRLPVAATQQASESLPATASQGLASNCNGNTIGWYRRLLPGIQHRPCNQVTKTTDAEQLLLAQQQQQQLSQSTTAATGTTLTAQPAHSTTATSGNPIVLGALSTAPKGDSDGEVDYYDRWHEDYVFPEEALGRDGTVTPDSPVAASVAAAIEASYDGTPLPDYDGPLVSSGLVMVSSEPSHE